MSNFNKYLISGLVIYYTIALLPVIQHGGGEIFPFFSFKLFSKTPQNFNLFDCEICTDPNECFSLFKNIPENNEIKRKYYYHQINTLGKQVVSGSDYTTDFLTQLFPNAYSIELFQLQGDYLEAVKQQKVTRNLIVKIK